jgi:putative hydrolase
MDDKPGETPDDGQNPFKGTPFEQLFGALGGQLGGAGNMGAIFGAPGAGGAAGGMPDLNQLFSQIQSLMQPYDGPLNWDVALDIARKQVAQSPDPSPSQRQKDAVADAVRLADHWLDDTTEFPSGVTSTAAWSRAEWLVGTLDVWKVLVEPVAESSVQALSGSLPQEAQAMAGPILGMIGKAVGGMFATQLGSGLGGLAAEVLSVSDIGLPLAAAGRAALVPTNVAAFADGLDVSEDDVLLYLALREAAHQRLFAHVPWLREHLIGAVADYARGIEVNAQGMQARIEEQMRGIDPTNPESMQELLEGGMFDLPRSPAQEAALRRLETTLALVEGWVDEVVGQATASRMPAAGKLQEAFRRRRAAGGPAEQTFATLVGLELRPRRLRDASTLWGSLRTRQGIEARDGVWMHPDLLPTAEDLDDPLGFREGASAPAQLSDEDFDAELQKLLGGGPSPGEGPDTPPSGSDPGSDPGQG